eukprot:TRINITY_DN8108_c1_g1_i1.p1 TRINITY_DN8108_c1_g1~~TRINITY_DN8108_c1_g1_i1.p1  ORF type:complete len:610 (+),score=97.18 TRINITY_DN8108_c1_g1_i1:125-1954(+)
MVLKFAITLVGLLINLATGNEQVPESWNIRRLLQSPQDLERLCSFKADMKGAFVMFNEKLLNDVCDKSSNVCGDIAPLYPDSGTDLTCDMVVEQGLCNDPYMLRSNFCAQSCKRCEGGSCTSTIAGCKCLEAWPYSGEVYSGCANPDNDPKGPWCNVDTSTCVDQPDGKDIDYCDPLCQQVGDQTVGVGVECEAFGKECSIVCNGEANVEQVVCYGVDSSARECQCKTKTIKGNTVAQLPIETAPMPKTSAADATNLKLVNAQIVGDCYNYLPTSEGICAQRVEWGSCQESWMSEKFYCAISCGLCDEQLSQEYDCLTDFKQCVNQCDGEQNMAEFACFRDLKKSECRCSKEIKRVASSVQDDIPTGDCVDFLPENEGTCALRKSWGSCDEQWMKDKNFCALTCGFCQPTAGSDVTTIGKTAYLGRTIFGGNTIPELTPPMKNPSSSSSSSSSSGSLWGVITSEANTLSVLSDVNSEIKFLEAHNVIRSAHCLPDLRWSYQLALEAQIQAEKCSPTAGPGQSVFYEQSSSATPLDVISKWYSPSENLDYSSLPPISKKTRALYQLLWEETTTVGCGQYDCDSNIKVVVCAYNPKGNDPKTIKQNVLPPC